MFVRTNCFVVCVCLLLISGMERAYAQDSTRTLRRLTLTAYKSAWAGNRLFPSVSLNREEIRQVSSTNAADIVRLFPGIIVKDYGGIGGLKTISVRSLGGQQSSVLYDGIALSDMQGGQVDLGKISSAGLQNVSLSHGQPSDMLYPARAFASAATLIIQSLSGQEQDDRPFYLSASIRGGSFGFINPSFMVGHRISRAVSQRFSAEYQQTDGRYPFVSYDLSGKTVRRQNSDAKNARFEYDASIRLADSNLIRVKAYQYYSDRGLPGSVIFFNPASRQRMTDRDFFVQATWKNSRAQKVQTLISGKYSHGYKRYTDPDFLNSRGMLENRFREQEWYGSAAATWQPASFMTWSLATDIYHTKLRRSGEFIGDSSNPTRNSWLTNLGLLLRFRKVSLQSGLLATQVSDRISRVNTAEAIHRITPTVALQYQPSDSLPLRFRFFYKEIFRVPTFNDLYYTFVGNVNLRPEYVRQFNVGFSLEGKPGSVLKEYAISVDAYFNRVRDKIMAVPRQNLFQWSMMNIGKADIRGADLSLMMRWKLIQKLTMATRLAYSYQSAKDVTDPQNPSYKNQLPYSPEHTGSLSAIFQYGPMSLSAQSVFSSLRYRPGDPIPENRLQAWSTLDIRLGWTKVTAAERKHEIFIELNNALNRQYEIIRFYPMPRVQYRVGYSFNIHS